ncbi:unnamed protein product [Rotaria magnacalcarata]|uniref:Uncharacterized protein n=3 Tax=Rotaria magnacalcarata TaxID=392030 RepID=A0A814XQ48_9BILA|nr:unnamed protein product [Rotaria magnacalcarata]
MAASSYIWLPPDKQGEFDVEIGARVVDLSQTQLKVVDDNGKERTIVNDPTKFKKMHATSFNEIQDMIHLGDLTEGAICRNILLRYNKDKIYTYIGSILIAVNPYTQLDLYNQEYLRAYRNRKFGELEPHTFAIGDNAYQNMLRERSGPDAKFNQCVIISGESGAGKTESTKHILQCLAAISGAKKNSSIEQQILEANPIMEAFGNAKTIRNDNSSRFGKYITVNFDSNGAIANAYVDQYLLEKIRLVSQAKEERNYHIFYCVLAGLAKEERNKLRLTKAADYMYLNKSTPKCDTRNDAEEWKAIRHACKVLMFTDDELFEILRILAIVLHLGNIQYTAQSSKGIDSVTIKDSKLVEFIASLLEVDAKHLNSALVTRTLEVQDSKVARTLSASSAADVRDAFVKGIYGQMFEWLIARINITMKNKNNANHQMQSDEQLRSIGVLDIFGFEKFEQNSFEQLCINYTNEELQQFFVHHVFKLEQTEYEKEGVDWKKIDFRDNQDIIDLLARNRMSIMAMIDEEMIVPQGTDTTLCAKLQQQHGKNKHFITQSARQTQKSLIFGIQHFAGPVSYDCRNFLEKNRDTFSNDLKQVLSRSTNRLIKTIFPLEALNLDDKKRKPSLATQFRKSLEVLLNTLRQCEPFFIRCIKPNEIKAVHNFDRERVVQQLRYSGMMETITIRRIGYPIRHDFNEFVHRYAAIAPALERMHKKAEARGDRGDQRTIAIKICEIALHGQDYQIGKNKVFLKDEHDAMLEQERQKVLAGRILALQNAVRRYYAQRQFQRAKKLALWLKQSWLCYAERRAYCEMRNGFRRLQAVYDMQHIDEKRKLYYETLPRIQTVGKAYLARKNAKMRPQAFGILQEKILQYLGWRDFRREQVKALKLEEYEKFRSDEEQLLTPELGPEKAREAAQAAYDARLVNLEEDIREQLRADIIRAREKQSGIKRRYRDDNANGEDGLPGSQRQLKQESDPFKTDVSRNSFEKFAAKYFQHGYDSKHTSTEIIRPLLDLKSGVDQKAAIATFQMIMRFMGDKEDITPPPTKGTKNDKEAQRLESQYDIIVPELYPIIAQQHQMKLEEEEDPYEKKKTKNIRRKAMDRIRAFSKKSVYLEDRLKNENPFVEDRYLTSLEKIQMITMLGIIRRRLRDEILCQICKQLNDHPAMRDKKSRNPEKSEQREKSYMRGWFLLCLCLYSFPPGSNLVRFLRNFVQNGPPNLANFAEFVLRRTYVNGSRNEPLSMEEINAIQKASPLQINVKVIHSVETLPICCDAATIAEEACTELARQLNITETFGWSLFAESNSEGYSIGFNKDHLFDILSRLEMGQIQKGEDPRNVDITFIFCKQLFAPWENLDDDPISIDLIYEQIINGMDPEEFVLLAVQHYYIIHGKDVESDKMKQVIQDILPSSYIIPQNGDGKTTNKKSKAVINEKQVDSMVELAIKKDADFKRVIKRLKQKFKGRDQVKREIKKDVILYAQNKWPITFSRVFEIQMLSGPLIDEIQFGNISVGRDKIRFYATDTFILLSELNYSEVTEIIGDHDPVLNYHHYTLQTVYGDYTFTLPMGADLGILLNLIHKNLKEKSTLAIAQKDYKPTKRGGGKLELLRGDIIVLDSESKNNVAAGVMTGVNDRTNREGEFPVDIVYIIPCTSKPESKVLRGLVLHVMKRAVDLNQDIEPQDHINLHTLEAYAQKYFRSRKTTAWYYEATDIKGPLLHRFDGQVELSAKAVSMFRAIMAYAMMTPVERKKIVQSDLDSIFDYAFEKNRALKEELYCQLVKQLTFCPDLKIETRIWELLWLLTGVLVPGKILFHHVTLFLRSSSNPVALECYNRIQKIQRQGERVRGPHVIECSANVNRVKIRQYVYFPNGHEQDFVVESTTKASELVSNICRELKFVPSSANGLSLYLETNKQQVSIPSNTYFFDFLTQLRGHDKKKLDYKIYFRRKLWIDIIPGDDKQADSIVHFYQEKDNYLLGLHKLEVEEAANLAALLGRADRGKGAPEANLSNFVPAYLVKATSQSDWAKKIYAATSNIRDVNEEDAKVRFLKHVAAWSTYGTTMYPIKNDTESEFPEDIYICINQNGVEIVDANTKESLSKYPYYNLNYNSNAISIFLEVHMGRSSKKYTFDTEIGDIIGDLIDDYMKIAEHEGKQDD